MASLTATTFEAVYFVSSSAANVTIDDEHQEISVVIPSDAVPPGYPVEVETDS
jgi:hypothetical protein